MRPERINYSAMRELDAFVKVEMSSGASVTTPDPFWVSVDVLDAFAALRSFRESFSGYSNVARFVERIQLYDEQKSYSRCLLLDEPIGRALSFEELCHEINLLLDRASSQKWLDTL